MERFRSGSWPHATPHRLLLSTASAALCLGALLAASDASQTSRSSPRPGVPIALTGCLRASDEPRVFLLTNAIRADADADQPDPDDAKPSPAAPVKNEGRTYRIVPLGAQLDLKSHVGERVDVGGRLATTDVLHGPPSKTGAGAAPETDDPAAGKDKQNSSRLEKSPPPTIAVTYVRKVAATCGASGEKP